jgi:hypothetical protein
VAAPVRAETFAERGADAVQTILSPAWYAGASRFRLCPGCRATNSDWGADSMIGALYERWMLTHDPHIARAFSQIVAGEPGLTLGTFSDVPMWDAVAAIRAYDVTHDPRALANAERNYRALVTTSGFALSPCPEIDYQLSGGAAGGLKTLETDANRILAAVLLSQRTTDAEEARADLRDAQTLYDAVRRRFRDPRLPLYTVYLFAEGTECRAVPRQFFASVNGLMIEAGLELAHATRDERYAKDARATADAIALLADGRGVFADLQAQNDIVEPLVLAMAKLARTDPKAKAWIVRNASAAALARAPDGSYGRFFDGPPPPRGGTNSVFETNGGLALAIAAAAFAPRAEPEPDVWSHARAHPVAIGGVPSTYAFTGSGIALIGALPRPGDRLCRPLTVGPCEGGHVHLRIDGREMADEIGIWQGKALVASSKTVLFAWRWPASGRHRIDFDRASSNAKQGETAIDVSEALILP